MAGLYAASLSATPTIAGTGFGTWVNQGGASIADTDAGMCLSIPNSGSDALRVRSKAAPATPYTITALVSVNASGADYSLGGFGWTDGTKYETLHLVASTGWKVEGVKWDSATAFNGVDFTGVPSGQNPVWLQIADDGTNIYMRFSYDGENFKQMFTVAKGSGFLANYNTLVFFGNSFGGGDLSVTAMSYAET